MLRKSQDNDGHPFVSSTEIGVTLQFGHALQQLPGAFVGSAPILAIDAVTNLALRTIWRRVDCSAMRRSPPTPVEP